ncbi:hypothetical protein P7K49_012033, partial [Saguinus oedipus]
QDQQGLFGARGNSLSEKWTRPQSPVSHRIETGLDAQKTEATPPQGTWLHLAGSIPENTA